MKKAILLIMMFFLGAPVFATVEDVVKQLLPDTDMKERSLILTDAEIEKVKKVLGEMTPVKGVFAVYSSKTGAVIIDEQYGNHGIIEFAVLIDKPTRSIRNIVILAMRERRGRGIKGTLFIRQFIGKTVADPITVGKDIKAYTGATISSRAAAVTAKRALVIYDIFLKRNLK